VTEVRIISGRNKGRKLSVPKGSSIRPTSDRIRESIFNILSSYLKGGFSGKVVADLFSGTGALGLEALSLPNGCFKANIAFLDPPYEQGMVSKALESVINNMWLERNALCVIEMSTKETFNCLLEFEQVDERKYGRTVIYFIKFKR
jgi:16S rRNA (guanine966-N2)-methyltransferase